jgi:hypothetical protein
VPVIAVAGNHEFDGRELDDAWPALRAHCASHGIRLLERDELICKTPDGRRIRILGTVRWCDFNGLGPARRQAAQRAGSYFQRVMGATLRGAAFDASAVREEALTCRSWLARALTSSAPNPVDATVVITHFAPSLESADPRYGLGNGTASFCNADDDLLPRADLWLHGHLHCRHDYVRAHADGRRTRVVSQARGLAAKGECDGFDADRLIDL